MKEGPACQTSRLSDGDGSSDNIMASPDKQPVSPPPSLCGALSLLAAAASPAVLHSKFPSRLQTLSRPASLNDSADDLNESPPALDGDTSGNGSGDGYGDGSGDGSGDGNRVRDVGGVGPFRRSPRRRVANRSDLGKRTMMENKRRETGPRKVPKTAAAMATRTPTTRGGSRPRAAKVAAAKALDTGEDPIHDVDDPEEIPRSRSRKPPSRKMSVVVGALGTTNMRHDRKGVLGSPSASSHGVMTAVPGLTPLPPPHSLAAVTTPTSALEGGGAGKSSPPSHAAPTTATLIPDPAPFPSGSSNKRGKKPEDRKLKKNTREKQRRLEVNQRFWKLSAILDLASSHKSDKVSVLDTAIDTIQTYRTNIRDLRAELDAVRSAIMMGRALATASAGPATSPMMLPLEGAPGTGPMNAVAAAAAAVTAVGRGDADVKSPHGGKTIHPPVSPLRPGATANGTSPPLPFAAVKPEAAPTLTLPSPRPVLGSASLTPSASADGSVDSGSTSTSNAAALALSLIGKAPACLDTNDLVAQTHS